MLLSNSKVPKILLSLFILALINQGEGAWKKCTIANELAYNHLVAASLDFIEMPLLAHLKQLVIHRWKT
jgi:hypothetical protein